MKSKSKIDKKWVITITILAFLISLVFSIISELIIPNVSLLISIILLIVVILLGIILDMVGVSVTVADLKTFNSMASQKVKGASLGVKFIKSANKVSSFCNDVIGDICGIISGSIGITLAFSLARRISINTTVITLTITALIASITIGGKALGKTIAINNSNKILLSFSKIIYPFTKTK